MPYKDKDNAKAAQRRYRDNKRITNAKDNVIPEPVPSVIPTVEPKIDIEFTKTKFRSGQLPANFGKLDCDCMHCQQNRHQGSKHVINHGTYKPANKLARNELNRVSLSGDVDYAGVCLDGKYDDRRREEVLV